MPHHAEQGKRHELKTWPIYFRHLKSGAKRFELRKDDRDIQTGDTLILREWGGEEMEYTGDSLTFLAGYVARGGVVPDGYCVIQLEAAAASRPATSPEKPERCPTCNGLRDFPLDVSPPTESGASATPGRCFSPFHSRAK